MSDYWVGPDGDGEPTIWNVADNPVGSSAVVRRCDVSPDAWDLMCRAVTERGLVIVDPFDPQQGITSDGKPAARIWVLPPGASPTGDLSEAMFLGLGDFNTAEGRH